MLDFNLMVSTIGQRQGRSQRVSEFEARGFQGSKLSRGASRNDAICIGTKGNWSFSPFAKVFPIGRLIDRVTYHRAEFTHQAVGHLSGDRQLVLALEF